MTNGEWQVSKWDRITSVPANVLSFRSGKFLGKDGEICRRHTHLFLLAMVTRCTDVGYHFVSIKLVIRAWRGRERESNAPCASDCFFLFWASVLVIATAGFYLLLGEHDALALALQVRRHCWAFDRVNYIHFPICCCYRHGWPRITKRLSWS